VSWPEPRPPVAVNPGLVRVASLNATPSAGFSAWLAGTGATLVVTTGDRLLTIGAVDPERPGDDDLVVGEHAADLAVGLTTDGPSTLHLATTWQLHRLEDALAGAAGPGGEDRLLVDQVSRTTGFVGVYDMAVDARGRLLFTNTLCNCVATPAERVHFSTVATPPFISSYVAEERCHLTGLALDEHGELAYLTCAAATDEAGGWRAAVADGGVVVDVHGDRVLATGLSLPCSPRVHEGRLYVANAGTGELLRIDRETGAADVVVTVPGLARGLTFVGGRAVLGCSVPPSEGAYEPLPIARHRPDVPRHGLAVVDLERGLVEHTVTLEAGSGDVHAVVALTDARRVGVQLQVSDREGWFSIGASPTT
jgi:uncharacterized protein (TIGR03032 family)